MVMVQSTMLPLGTSAPAFALPDTEGRTVTLAEFAGKPLVVVFMCNHCPFVKHLAQALATFTTDVAKQGVAVVGISSNDITTHPADAPDRMKEERAARGWTFPYLFDASQDVAKAYRAACTPDFYLFDRAHRLVYRGRFDATRPNQGTPDGADLRAAVAAVLAGKPQALAQLPSVGCNIKWKKDAVPEWFA